MPFSIGKLFSGSRARTRDIVCNAIIGDVNGLVIQQIGSGALPELPSLPWRDLPDPSINPADTDLFNLLTWRSRLCRNLFGREADCRDLLAWADGDRPFAIRVLSGEGGARKTRLAAEMIDRLRTDGWCAGFASLDVNHSLPVTRKGLFVVLDYPESHRKVVQAILRAVGRMERTPGAAPAPVRIVLLSRQNLDWWFGDLVDAGASELAGGQECAVRALDAADTCQLVREAVARLSEHYCREVRLPDEATIAAWHSREPALHGLPLFASAAALHAVFDAEPTFELGGGGIIRALVTRERSRLDRAARAAGWPGTRAGSRLLGLAALPGVLDATALRRLTTTAPGIGLPPAERIIDEVQRLGWWRDGGVPAPQPDIIAAELLRQSIEDQRQDAPAWMAAALDGPQPPEPERLGRLAHDIATVAGDDASADLVGCLVRAVQEQPERARHWRVLFDSEATTFRLSPLAVAIGQTLLAVADLSDEGRAAILNGLSIRLSDAGDRAGALTTIQEAVAIHRRLAAANPLRFEPDLAQSLNNLSSDLGDAGDRARALTAIQQAVAIRRPLAAANPSRFEADLAQSLNNLSNRLGDAGDRAAALTAIQEAVAIRRPLAAANLSRFEPDLALSLNNLSGRLSDAGDRAAALSAIQEAVAIRRRLAAANPSRFEPNLAVSLNNLSNRLSDAGDRAGALTAIQEAVAIRRRVAGANPSRFEPDLAGSLNNLSNRLSDAGDREGELKAIQEAVAIRRRVAGASPSRFEPDLAQSLNNLSNRLSDAGDREGELKAIQEAVAIRRRLAGANPSRFEPDLAQSLNNLSNSLSDAGDRAGALTTIQEAVAIRRRLAGANPSRFEPDLARSLALEAHLLGLS